MNMLNNYIELIILTTVISFIFPWLSHLLLWLSILEQKPSGQSMGLGTQELHCSLNTGSYILWQHADGCTV